MSEPSKEAVEAAAATLDGLVGGVQNEFEESPVFIALRNRQRAKLAAALDAFASARVAEERERNIELLKKLDAHCLCTRNTPGFDYAEPHRILGKPKSGSRWLTPGDIIQEHQRARTPKPSAEKCGHCGGVGTYEDVLPIGQSDTVTCDWCKGTGINEKGE